MIMDFEGVANEIIEQSIRSAICIDDKFVEPYSSGSEEGYDIHTPEKMYRSFRDKNCSLDIYRFKNTDEWEEKKEYIFKNRDLLILDWELKDPGIFEDSLNILKEAIELDSLPFVIIYTHEKNVDNIKLQIHSFFESNCSNNSTRDDLYGELCEELDEQFESLDSHKMFESIADELKQYILVPTPQKRGIRTKINRTMMEYFPERRDSGTFFKKLKSSCKEIFKLEDDDEILKLLGFHLNNAIAGNGQTLYSVIPIESFENSFLINNTNVIVYHKPNSFSDREENTILPEDIYSKFAESVKKQPHNFLALLSLEMKNLYLNNSGIIGNELYGVDERAFFYHQNNLKSEDQFYDFLSTLWRNELLIFNSTKTPKLFSVLEDYKTSQGIDARVSDFKEKHHEEFLDELVKLNYHYSFSRTERDSNDKIRFGDLFILTLDGEADIDKFLLCITPHCDCVAPKKVNNKLYFVTGKESKPRYSLENAEKEYFSFIIFDEKPICIEWNDRPFTIHIHEENNMISRPIRLKSHNKEYFYSYKENLKENYAQRIANNSFSMASRVGINLVNIEESSES